MKRVMGLVLIFAVTTLAFLGFISGVAGQDAEAGRAAGLAPSVTTSAFTYQGQLEVGGEPANGVYDFEFRLYDAATGGEQVANTLTFDDVMVTEGLFTVLLDFGAEALQGGARYLEIAVREGESTGDYTALNPLQELTPVPYAMYAGSVPWSGLTDVPAGLEDGDDVTSISAGSGLTLDGSEISVAFAGSGGAATVARSDHEHWGAIWSGPEETTGLTLEGGSNGLVITGTNSYGAKLRSNGVGMQVVSLGGHGIDINGAHFDGLEIDWAGRDGVNVDWGDDDGVSVDDAGDNGIEVKAATNYAGWFGGDLFVAGSCTNCTVSAFAINSSSEPLSPGDPVTVVATRSGEETGTPVLLEVAPADAGQSVVGVVQGNAELVESTRTRAVEPGERVVELPNKLVPRTGVAQPNDYVTVIIYGVAQVKATSLEQAIDAGSRVTLATDGSARALQTRTVDGMLVAESAPTIGIALEPLSTGQAERMIWVLVNPQ